MCHQPTIDNVLAYSRHSREQHAHLSNLRVAALWVEQQVGVRDDQPKTVPSAMSQSHHARGVIAQTVMIKLQLLCLFTRKRTATDEYRAPFALLR
jgi:hypothetical protein